MTSPKVFTMLFIANSKLIYPNHAVSPFTRYMEPTHIEIELTTTPNISCLTLALTLSLQLIGSLLDPVYA